MSEKKALYSIKGFNTEPKLGMGMYGFSIVIDADVVRYLIETERHPDAPMLQALQDRLKNSLPKHSAPEIRFHENTWLLIGITAGGQCACMGIDGGFRKEDALIHGIRYSPHNIDSPVQAAAILSTWLLWFNSVLPTFTPYRMPFAV